MFHQTCSLSTENKSSINPISFLTTSLDPFPFRLFPLEPIWINKHGGTFDSVIPSKFQLWSQRTGSFCRLLSICHCRHFPGTTRDRQVSSHLGHDSDKTWIIDVIFEMNTQTHTQNHSQSRTNGKIRFGAKWLSDCAAPLIQFGKANFDPPPPKVSKLLAGWKRTGPLLSQKSNVYLFRCQIKELFPSCRRTDIKKASDPKLDLLRNV